MTLDVKNALAVFNANGISIHREFNTLTVEQLEVINDLIKKDQYPKSPRHYFNAVKSRHVFGRSGSNRKWNTQ